MPLYRYVKAQPAAIPQTISLPQNLIPFILMATGFFLIATIATPILYHLLVVFPKNQNRADLMIQVGSNKERLIDIVGGDPTVRI